MSQEEYLQTVASRVLYSRSCGAFYLSLLVASLTEREQQREASDEDQMTADSGPPTSFVQAAGGAEMAPAFDED